MSLKFITLIAAFFCSHSLMAANALNAQKNTNTAQAIQSTIKGLTANPPVERTYMKGFQQIRYSFDDKVVKDCAFIKIVSISDDEYINLPVKGCDEMVLKMSYDKSYTPKNVIYFDFVPAECTHRNFTGKLYKCN